MIQGKIYKLVNNVDSSIYVGSTKTSLPKRFYGHKDTAKRNPTRRVYAHLVPIGWENVRIILIENYICNSKEELVAREQYYIDLLKPSLNRIASFGNTCKHAKRRDSCVECDGSQMCLHNRRRMTCVECNGSQMCLHNRRRSHCVECSPIDCDFCDKTYSKGAFPTHLQSTKHKINYCAEFLRVFETEMKIEDVPEY